VLKSEFRYQLPPELIAQFPVEPRSASRLLVLQPDSGAIIDAQFADFPQWLQARGFAGFQQHPRDSCPSLRA